MVCDSMEVKLNLLPSDLEIVNMGLRLEGEPNCGTACTCTIRQSDVSWLGVICEVTVRNNSVTDIMQAKVAVELCKNGSPTGSLIPMQNGMNYEITRCLNYGGDNTLIMSDVFSLPSNVGIYTPVVVTLEPVECMF